MTGCDHLVELTRTRCRPSRVAALHARAGHHRVAEVVSEAVVVAGDHCEPPSHNQRSENLVELVPFFEPTAVRDVARDEHVVDADLHQRTRELLGLGVVVGAAPHVEVREMRQHPRTPHPPQVRDAQHFPHHWDQR